MGVMENVTEILGIISYGLYMIYKIKGNSLRVAVYYLDLLSFTFYLIHLLQVFYLLHKQLRTFLINIIQK